MALELKDLNDDERLALVALIEQAVEADRTVSAGEEREVHAIVAAVGKKAYEAAAEESDRRFSEDGEKLWLFLGTITRQEAREQIFETLLETVLADAPRSEETEVLERLSKLWHIKPRIVDEEE